jgi:biotin carboxylase
MWPMNLLVTNSQSAQAYSIIRALRPYATKIVATMEGKHRWAARTAHAANSRFVDRRYYVPRADLDWKAGIIQKQNTEREEAYVQRIREICRLEQIDTIFPSYDPLVYVFAKNRDRFKDVLIPVPSYETLLTPLDKYRTIEAAQRVGFPCPKTYVPESVSDVDRITRELDPPWVLKRRFTAGGEGMAFFTDVAPLREAIGKVRDRHSMPMIQEYIPGRERQHFYVIADRDGEIQALLCPRVVRYGSRLYSDTSGAVESAVAHPLVPVVKKLVRDMGWRGGLTIQTKVDIRDGMPKLLEMNPRLGLRLWFRTELGCNEPLMCLRIAKGEEVPEHHYPVGTLLLAPLEDTFRFGLDILDSLVYRVRIRVLGKRPIDPHNPPRPLTDLARAYARDYFGSQPKVFSPYSKYLLDDPLPCLLWWYALAGFSVRSLRTLGR